MGRYITTDYLVAACWVAMVFAAMLGLGRLVARWVDEPESREGWGLHAVWGMALFLLLGGMLSVFGLCNDLAIFSTIVAGSLFLVWDLRASLPQWRTWASGWSWGMVPLLAIVAFLFYGGVCWIGNVNPADDQVAYFSFTEKLLKTGAVVEPFSWRRLASLGGQTLLQSAVLVRTSYTNVQAFETAICPVILFGLLSGFRRGVMMKSLAGLFVCFVALTTNVIRVNTTSHLTGIVLFLGLFVTLDRIERTGGRLRLWAVAGVIAAGMCSLRSNFIPAAGLALGLFWLSFWRQAGWSLAEAGKALAVWAGAMFLSLLPWMIQTYVSNGTPLYPLFNGSNSTGFDPYSPAQTLSGRIVFAGKLLSKESILPLLLWPLAWFDFRKGVAASSVAIAGLVTSLLLAFSISLAPIGRYMQPLLLAGGLAALMLRVQSGRQLWLVFLLSGYSLLENFPARVGAFVTCRSMVRDAARVILTHPRKQIVDHQKAQLLVPEGERILVCSENSVLFDHGRNTIWNIDMPGGTSPGTGIPFQQPPEAMKRYLMDLGVHYVIFTDFTLSTQLYSRSVWEKHHAGPPSFYRSQSTYYLDFFDTIEALAKTEPVLGRTGELTVIRLER